MGLGLIGSSVALALGEVGLVRHRDGPRRPRSSEAALGTGVIVRHELDAEDVDLVVIATPAGVVAEVAHDVLARVTQEPTSSSPTSPASRAPSSTEVSDPRFLGGHPMAGSELRGLAGARADLFRGLHLGPHAHLGTRSPRPTRTLHGFLRELGANVVAVRRRRSRPARRRGEPRPSPARGSPHERGESRGRAGRGACYSSPPEDFAT